MIKTMNEKIMKNLKRIETKDLERLNSLLCDAQRILNVDDKSLSDMNLEDDGLLIDIIDVNLKVFNEICRRSRINRKQEHARQRIRTHLMSLDSDLTVGEADSYIDNAISEINGADDIHEAEEIWYAYFNLEMDDLNDLMGW